MVCVYVYIYIYIYIYTYTHTCIYIPFSPPFFLSTFSYCTLYYRPTKSCAGQNWAVNQRLDGLDRQTDRCGHGDELTDRRTPPSIFCPFLS